MPTVGRALCSYLCPAQMQAVEGINCFLLCRICMEHSH